MRDRLDHSVYFTINKSNRTCTIESEALFARIATDRDQDAFSELIERYEEPAYNLALCITCDRYLAEDAVQDSFLQIWSNADKFRASCGSAKAWILGIVAHRALDQKKKIRKYVPLGPEHLIIDIPQGMESEREEEASRLKDAYSKLTDFDEQLLFLYYEQGLTQREIAEHYSCSQRTISAQLLSAVRILRMNLDRPCLVQKANARFSL